MRTSEAELRLRGEMWAPMISLSRKVSARLDITDIFHAGEIHKRQARQLSHLFAIAKPTFRKSASGPKIEVFPRTFKTILLLNRFALRVT